MSLNDFTNFMNKKISKRNKAIKKCFRPVSLDRKYLDIKNAKPSKARKLVKNYFHHVDQETTSDALRKNHLNQYQKTYVKALNQLNAGLDPSSSLYPILRFYDSKDGNHEQIVACGDTYSGIPSLYHELKAYGDSGQFMLIHIDAPYLLNGLQKRNKDQTNYDYSQYGAQIENMKNGIRVNLIDILVHLCYKDTINLQIFGSQDEIEVLEWYFKHHYHCSYKVYTKPKKNPSDKAKKEHAEQRDINKRDPNFDQNDVKNQKNVNNNKDGNMRLINVNKGNGRKDHNDIRMNSEYCLYVHKNVILENNNSKKYQITTGSYKVSENQCEDTTFHHPDVKPEYIIRNLIQIGTDIKEPKGEPRRVLDCFCGTGTSAVACRMLHLSGVFIDYSEECVESTLKRMLAPNLINVGLLKAEWWHLDRMQSESMKLKRGNYESFKDMVRNYSQAQHSNIKPANNVHSAFNRIQESLGRYVMDRDELSYVKRNVDIKHLYDKGNTWDRKIHKQQVAYKRQLKQKEIDRIFKVGCLNWIKVDVKTLPNPSNRDDTKLNKKIHKELVKKGLSKSSKDQIEIID